MKSRKKGILIVGKAIGKFQGIIDELGNGINTCEVEIDNNQQDINTLTAENGSIEQSKIQASSFKVNLEKMLEIPSQ